MSESPVKLLDQLMHGFKKLDDEEVVVLSQVRRTRIPRMMSRITWPRATSLVRPCCD